MKLEDFARAVNDQAGREDGWSGGRKVFIATVYRGLRTRFPSYFGKLTPAQFKLNLVNANRRGLVVLIRADLVAAMPAALVAESETRHLEATWHFIEKPGFLARVFG